MLLLGCQGLREPYNFTIGRKFRGFLKPTPYFIKSSQDPESRRTEPNITQWIGEKCRSRAHSPIPPNYQNEARIVSCKTGSWQTHRADLQVHIYLGTPPPPSWLDLRNNPISTCLLPIPRESSHHHWCQAGRVEVLAYSPQLGSATLSPRKAALNSRSHHK